jgi:predicted DsbA family dithiol-disulfide isomerase
MADAPARLEAIVWTDYLCPWCWLGRSQTALLEDLGVAVTPRPFELHPDLPAEGRPVRADGRLASVYARIGAECAARGLPFNPPKRVSRSRRALETSEVVRAIARDQFAELDDSLYRAVFVDGDDIADQRVLDARVENAGLDAADIRARVDDGQGRAAVDDSMRDAYEHGVAATPTWLVAGTLLVPGIQPPEVVERWIGRLRERAGAEAGHARER